MLCSPVIGSQSFGEPVPLDYELHQCFLVPSPYPHPPKMGQDGWRGLELGISLPPGRLGSDQAPAG